MGKLRLNGGSNSNNGPLKLKNNANNVDQYEKIKKELEEDFIQDMSDNAISVEISEDEMEKTQKRYKNLFLKKMILYVSIILVLLSIVLFGAYKTFFEHKYTGKEIAILANYYNGKTNFPENGIQGYLESNMDKLLKEKLSIDSKVTEMSIGRPIVTKINAKNNNLANVYFYTTVNSNIGETTVNCVLPISWDDKNQTYTPAGSVMFTPNKSTNSNVKETENSLLSFSEIAKEDTEKIESSKTFVNNFFTMLYSGQDVTPYYKGDSKLEVSNLKYDGMTEYMLYKDTNGNGYNTSVKITLVMDNGISYVTQKYLTIEKSGESWIVTAVL